jgi:hypothetical protein
MFELAFGGHEHEKFSKDRVMQVKISRILISSFFKKIMK